MLTSRAHKLIGFTVGGVALVVLADILPAAAIGVAAAIAIGVVVSHPAELQQMSGLFVAATGDTSSGVTRGGRKPGQM